MVLLTDNTLIFSGLKHGSTMLHWQAEQLGYAEDELLPPNYSTSSPETVLRILLLNTTSHPKYGVRIKEALLENKKSRKVVVYTRNPEMAIYSAIAESVIQLQRSGMFCLEASKKYNIKKSVLQTVNSMSFIDPMSHPVVEKFTEIGLERALERSHESIDRFDFNAVTVLDLLTDEELEEYFTFWLTEFLPNIITYDNHIHACVKYASSIFEFFDIINQLNNNRVPDNFITLNLDTYSVNVDFTKHLVEENILFPEFKVQSDHERRYKHVSYSLRKYHSIISNVLNQVDSGYIKHRIAEYSYFKNLLDTQYDVEYTYEKFVSLKDK